MRDINRRVALWGLDPDPPVISFGNMTMYRLLNDILLDGMIASYNFDLDLPKSECFL